VRRADDRAEAERQIEVRETLGQRSARIAERLCGPDCGAARGDVERQIRDG
jgi:hypothetical protein